MNATNQTTDARCNELAREAIGLAYRVTTFKPMGRFNDPQRVVDLADRIIALREGEATTPRYCHDCGTMHARNADGVCDDSRELQS